MIRKNGPPPPNLRNNVPSCMLFCYVPCIFILWSIVYYFNYSCGGHPHTPSIYPNY